jgi:hypothetical protein
MVRPVIVANVLLLLALGRGTAQTPPDPDQGDKTTPLLPRLVRERLASNPRTTSSDGIRIDEPSRTVPNGSQPTDATAIPETPQECSLSDVEWSDFSAEQIEPSTVEYRVRKVHAWLLHKHMQNAEGLSAPVDSYEWEQNAFSPQPSHRHLWSWR